MADNNKKSNFSSLSQGEGRGEALITGAEALMRSLEHQGVKTIFGYPGGSIMPVFDALYDHRKELNHILVRHEQGATHAAQGFARVSGEVGVCLVTSGPGATNTITGIADAMIDSTPIVVIAGQVGTNFLGTDAFQEVDLVGITQPITKWSYQIRRAEDVAWAVARAFYVAKSGRPGPVVLDFAKNAQVEKTEYAPTKVDYVRSYLPVPEMEPEAIRKAAELINGAERPLVLVGQGVELGEAQQELRAFIEKAGMPAGCTLLGLSALPTNHPLNKGMLGMHGNLGPNINTNKCDVLIAVGMRFDDRVTGKLETYAKQAKIIHFDIDPAEIDKNVKTDVAVLGDCKETLAAVTQLLEPANHQEWIDSFRQYEEVEEEKVIRPELHPAGKALSMGEVVRAVSEATHNEAILVTDVGQNQMMSARYFKYSKERSIVTSGGLGTMGFGLPAAIGATWTSEPHGMRIHGGGGLQMNLQELGTIMEQKAPVKMILLNNNFLGNVRQWQAMFFNRRYSFTPMMNPDYMKIASAYDIPARRVMTREELAKAIEEMIVTDGPFLLEACVEEEGNVMPMTPPGGGGQSDVVGMLKSCEIKEFTLSMDKKLYTIIVHSENFAGLLNQVTAVFTRRQINIESLNVSASSIKGVHKYTITAWTDKDTIEKVTKQITKKIDVLQAHYFTDDEIYQHEIALYKITTPTLEEKPEVSKVIRKYNARIVEVNAVFAIVEKNGMSEEITNLYEELRQLDCVLQFVRSGRVAITTSCFERVNEYLADREAKYRQSKHQES